MKRALLFLLFASCGNYSNNFGEYEGTVDAYPGGLVASFWTKDDCNCHKLRPKIIGECSVDLDRPDPSCMCNSCFESLTIRDSLPTPPNFDGAIAASVLNLRAGEIVTLYLKGCKGDFEVTVTIPGSDTISIESRTVSHRPAVVWTPHEGDFVFLTNYEGISRTMCMIEDDGYDDQYVHRNAEIAVSSYTRQFSMNAERINVYSRKDSKGVLIE
jgi:hypothetical protein